MQFTGIIITGSSGYLGSNLIHQLDPNSILLINRNSFNDSDIIFFDVNNQAVRPSNKFKDYKLIHLATYYSKKFEDKEKIWDANIHFGEKILSKLKNLNLKKIVYTNTMFNFYDDLSVKNLEYTKTKELFSETLWNYGNEKSIEIDEIYLDNTFGGNDNRNKIVQLIIRELLETKQSSIQNKKATINLIPYDAVLKRIKNSLNREITGKSSFVYEKSVQIESVNNFLNEYFKTNIQNNSLLKYSENNYNSDVPDNLFINNNKSELEDKLINYFNYLQTRFT